MATVKEKQLAGVIVTLASILAAEVAVTNWSQTYYCESEDNIKECFSLSSTNRTCYDWLGRRDLCVDGFWRPLEENVQKPMGIQQFKVHANDKDWICQAKKNEVTSYTKCYSDIYEGYLGELI